MPSGVIYTEKLRRSRSRCTTRRASWMQLRADSRYTFTRHTFVYLFPHPYVSATILAAVASSSSCSHSLAEFVRARANMLVYLVNIARCIFLISRWSSLRRRDAFHPLTFLHISARFISRAPADRGYYKPRAKKRIIILLL